MMAQDGVDPEATTIDCLPSEILVYIFHVLRHLTGWDDLPLYHRRNWERIRRGEVDSRNTVMEWIHTTWVRRHWRAVALASPGLWSKLQVIHRQNKPVQAWLPVFLERAMGALLDVSVLLSTHDGEDVSSEYANFALNTSSIIGTQFATSFLLFRVSVSTKFIDSIFPSPATPMHSLEHLHLHDIRPQLTTVAPTTFAQLTRGHLPRILSLWRICLSHRRLPSTNLSDCWALMQDAKFPCR
ncbi:hypothetical protein C8Q80DRAFT_178480 [Daedaleopsis nitida]|nr:hypothetical protein C8Q80DRAFT_178480 [Daedaleopsis nitida]